MIHNESVFIDLLVCHIFFSFGNILSGKDRSDLMDLLMKFLYTVPKHGRMNLQCA